MNDGFMHPAYPEQVMFSYYQASLVCELIAKDYGEDALLRMLQGYKAGLTTDQVFTQVLKVEPAAFDKKFDAYMRERFAAPLAGLDEFRARLTEGRAAFDRQQYDAALPALERAKAIFPQFGGDGSPYWYLAMIYKAKGDTRRAADELGRLVGLNETDYKAYLELAALRQNLGDAKGAAAALDGAMYINPFEPAAHKQLAELYRAAGEPAKVVRERKAFIALDPVDRSDALYELATAQRAAGDAAGARKSVLRALEDAPNFEKAQTLLLSLYEERTAGRKP